MNSIIQKILEEHDKWSDPEYCLQAVKENGENLELVKIQTPEICLAAIQEDGRSLEYVKNQTPDLCMAAVQQNGRALKFVKHQTPEICAAAIKQYPEIYRCIRLPKDENERDKFLRELGLLLLSA